MAKSSRAKSRAKKNYDNYKSNKDMVPNSKANSSSRKYSKEENDSSWYTRNAQLALDAGRLAFTWPTGAPVTMDYISGTDIIGLSGDTIRFPGVMELPFFPTFGTATSADDPINISAFNIYSFVRHMNSGHTNYDAPDLMLYLMAMDSIYTYYQHMCRIYGLVQLFAQRNRNLPLAVFDALNVDYDDILSNLADFRAYINVCALKIGSMVVPATMPIYVRHMWMASGLYADSPSIKSQFYVFRPGASGVYNERTSSTGGYLATMIHSRANKDTFATLKTNMDAMIAAVVASEDCNIMSGDIKKAYSEDQVFKLEQISENYVVEPVFSEEVLRQIQNATIANSISYVSSKMLDQDINAGILKANYTINFTGPNINGKKIMTGTSEDPSPEEVLVSSRLMIGGEFTETTVSNQPQWRSSNPVVGSEVIANAHIYTLDNLEKNVAYCMARQGTTSPVLPSVTVMQMLSLLNFFNYHPCVNYVGVVKDSSDAYVSASVYPVFDVDNYAVVDTHDIEKLHNTAILSLLDVPQLGRVK